MSSLFEQFEKCCQAKNKIRSNFIRLTDHLKNLINLVARGGMNLRRADHDPEYREIVAITNQSSYWPTSLLTSALSSIADTQVNCTNGSFPPFMQNYCIAAIGNMGSMLPIDSSKLYKYERLL